jgi:uncharacterized protein YdeI (YjbR/CyaY-like superfamily)
MDIGETLLVASPEEWRAWLTRHYQDRKDIWLVFYKKSSGRTGGITYDEAVEEALCFGWIDSQTKSIDAESFALRFTPRRPRGNWSATNRAAVVRLAVEGRMTEAGKAALPPDLLVDLS